jgi:hypothetical protein
MLALGGVLIRAYLTVVLIWRGVRRWLDYDA